MSYARNIFFAVLVLSLAACSPRIYGTLQLVDANMQPIPAAKESPQGTVVNMINTTVAIEQASHAVTVNAEGMFAEKQAELRHECPGKDLISALLAPTIDGERLTDLQFKNLFVLMISAGNDTTRYTMAAGLKALAENPEQFQELRQACVDGDAVIVDRAVEEVLRWGSVTMHFRRTATQDVEMHGQTIRKGDKVLEWLSSANFDERQFPDPFRFDVHRWPNDHVAFNLRSPHLCLGAQLARMELKLLLQELLPRITAVEVVGPVERLRSNFICGMKRLPVKVSWT